MAAAVNAMDIGRVLPFGALRSWALTNWRYVLPAVVLLNGLGAYNIGRIPLQWLANLAAIGVGVGLVFLTRRIHHFPGARTLVLLVFWGLTATLVNGLVTDFRELTPPNTTTSYEGYVYLRIVTILAFVGVAYVVCVLAKSGHRDFVITSIVVVASLIAVISLYIYVAQIYGLPEPPRTRLGTGGVGGQSTLFSSGGRPGGFFYHRAMGTFREPSHLGEWLVAPFFLSLTMRGAKASLCAAALGLTLLLTASMTAIIGAALGLAAALLITNPLRAQNRRILLAVGQFAALAAIAVYLIQALGVAPQGRNDSVLAALVGRTSEVLSGTARDRYYVRDYVELAPWSALGYGFGHGNLLFSRAVGGAGSATVTSFLSLYMNAAFTVGVLGLGVLVFWLVRPVLAVAGAVRRHLTDEGQAVLLLAAYCAWLVMYAVDPEELTIMFAVVYGLLVNAGQPRGQPLPAETREAA